MTRSVLLASLVLFAAAACSNHPLFGCPEGLHQAMHTIDIYDLSPLGGGEGVYGHKLGDRIPVKGVCWPDDKEGG